MTIRASDKILQRLLTLHPKIIDLSLDRMHVILAKLDNPERKLPPVIHVAGTNGKGSTIAYLRSILEAANLSVHVYTSPHLVRFAERIRLNGKIIEEAYLQETLEYCEKINDGEAITYFEITTAAAFKAFSENQADVLILEVGLGGRLDATNVVDTPLATILSPISLDHQQFLGSQLKHIAMEKASIAKKGVPLVTAGQTDEVMSVIKEITMQQQGKLETKWTYKPTKSGFSYSDSNGNLDLPMPNLTGPHQIANAALAVATLRHQGKLNLHDKNFKTGVTEAKWPARMQNITESTFGKLLPEGSELWLDGGHNPAAACVIADSFSGENLTIICGMMKNKDTHGYLQTLAGQTTQLFGVHVEGEDSHNATEIVKIAWSLGIKAQPAQDVWDALENIDKTGPVKVLICGSLYLAGQVLEDNGLIPQ